MRKILPYPLLSLAILLMWLMLSGFTLGQFILGAIVALLSGLAATRLKQPKPKIQNWRLLPVLLWRTILDLIISNISVAKIILTGGRTKNPSGFIVIQLSLKSQASIATLACILTLTPGTAWIAYNQRSGRLVLHVLDLIEENYWSETIKKRYETLLLEIFE